MGISALNKVTEVIIAHGHKNIRAAHRTTFEITREENLTARGDCIIAVKEDKSVADLSREFKELARKREAEITIMIEAGGEREEVKARGDPRLTFTHPEDIVVRRSSYVCGRTLAVKADKAARDLSRRLVEKLRDPNSTVKITITVKDTAN